MASITGIKTSLTGITESDAEDMIKLRNNPAYNKYLFQSTLTADEQRNWISKNKDRKDAYNFKIENLDGEFKGTISIYNIDNKAGEFGRYIATNPVNAIEAEYLLLKICFEELDIERIYCQTNIANRSVWSQHLKLGFRTVEEKEVIVGSGGGIPVTAVVQEITKEEYKKFDYDKIIRLIKHF
ncbi:MAG: GNAT family N-acetyltransferase [Chitinophagaceae bacterium]